MIKAIKVTIIFLLTFLLIKVHANESEKVESASKDPLTEWNELRESRNFHPFFSLK